MIENFNQSEYKSICHKSSLSSQFVLKMQRCDNCPKSFANRQNQNRHRRKIRGLNKNEHELYCSSCDFNCQTLLEMKVHGSYQHNGKPSRICVYCKNISMTESDFRKHYGNSSHFTWVIRQTKRATEISVQLATTHSKSSKLR